MRRNARTPRTSSTVIMLVVGLASGALVVLDADHGSPNTGMADSVPLSIHREVLPLTARLQHSGWLGCRASVRRTLCFRPP
jgi:hypothetical protein